MSSPKSQSRSGDHTSPKADAPAEVREFRLGQLIEVEWHNCETKRSEWREATFLHYYDASDRPWRAEVEIQGRRVLGVAPECIRSRQPAAPQPAKAAQEHYATSGNQRLRNIEENWRRSFNQMRDERDEAQAELERVKEALAVAQSQIDNNDATLAQVKLCHKSQIERVKGKLALEQLQVKTNWDAYKEAERLLNAAEQQRNELLAALKRIDSELEGRLPVTALIKEIAQAAIAKAEKGAS